MGADGDDEQPLRTALVEELMRKSAMCWVRLADSGRDRAVWHVWHQGAAYVVSGGSEQPLPGADVAEAATVVARTKDSRQRLLAWRADVSVVGPEDPRWQDVVHALLTARLNLRDPDTAADRWARECVVTCLTPTGELVESPEAVPDGDLAAPPVTTPATTRRGLPGVLHRRQRRRPDLRSH